MAADYIAINKAAKQHGNRMVRAAELIVELRSIIDSEFSCANHMVDGSDYSVFESQFGMTSGVGSNALNLLGLIRGILLTADDIPGANRKAWLDEFCARVAGQ
jgi:hypothetical protein